jgi:hypothetical protein
VRIEYIQFELECFQYKVLLFGAVNLIQVSKLVVYAQRVQCLLGIRNEGGEYDGSE